MKNKWSEWMKFPHPSKGEYLYAPFGFGVYQLRRIASKQYILFGRSKNIAARMSTLLPLPLGYGGRKNTDKREYIWNSIDDVEYRTMSLNSEQECKHVEYKLKTEQDYIFSETSK